MNALKEDIENKSRINEQNHDKKIGESDAKFSGLTIFENLLFTKIYQLLMRGFNKVCFTQYKKGSLLKNKIYSEIRLFL
jgi:hypothetical protein